MPLAKKTFSLYLLILVANALVAFYFFLQPLSYLNWHDLLNIIYQAKVEPIASVKNSFNKSFLLDIKVLFSRGILLFLTFWVSVYILLLVKWKPNDIFFKRLCFCLSTVLIIGTIGIYGHSQKKLKTYTPLWPTSALSLHEGDELQQSITFTRFDEKFLELLKRTVAGEIKLSIQNGNSANDHQLNDLSRTYYQPILIIGEIPVDISKSNYLETHHAAELLEKKSLIYKYKMIRGGFFYLYVRAAGKPMTCREDTLTLNNNAIPLLDQDNLLEYLPLIFRFEELSGKPIIAFY